MEPSTGILGMLTEHDTGTAGRRKFLGHLTPKLEQALGERRNHWYGENVSAVHLSNLVFFFSFELWDCAIRVTISGLGRVLHLI